MQKGKFKISADQIKGTLVKHVELAKSKLNPRCTNSSTSRIIWVTWRSCRPNWTCMNQSNWRKSMAQPKFIDNTQNGCWGYQPAPTQHDAFVGWRTILERDWKTGRQRLDYVPGRGSSRGLETDCNRLVRWWSKGRNALEKQFLKDRTTTVSFFRSECKKGVMTAYAQRSADYAYISLYLDYIKEAQT